MLFLLILTKLVLVLGLCGVLFTWFFVVIAAFIIAGEKSSAPVLFGGIVGVLFLLTTLIWLDQVGVWLWIRNFKF